ncbi:MAG: hypothetical protein IKY39_01920 [Clostridia bacterium]|nr:hypothetical protein [Clostridia bacterium]
MRGRLEYKADNGIGLYSEDRPELSCSGVCLRGEVREYDSEVSCECHDSIRDAKEQIQKIQEAVKEFNQQYKPSTDEEPDDIEVVIAE